MEVPTSFQGLVLAIVSPPDFSSLAREVTAPLHSEESSERPSLNARAKTFPCCVLWPPRCTALQSPGRSPCRSFPRHSRVPRHPQGLTHSEREANVLSKQKGSVSAVTTHHRGRGLNNTVVSQETTFLTVLKAVLLGSSCQQIPLLAEVLFLACRQLSSR